jgi:hypothetical protein
LTFYSPPAVWSHPLLWGASRAVAEAAIAIQTTPVNNADKPSGSVSGSKAGAYAYEPTSIAAYQVTNQLLNRGVAVQRASSAFADRGISFEPGSFIVPADSSLANELANQHGLDVFAISEKSSASPSMPTRARITPSKCLASITTRSEEVM